MDLKLKKKISKMNMEELNKFLDNECNTLQDRENLLFELNNKPYIELSEKYKDIKDLPNIILDNGKKITLDFDYLKLDDDFIFEHYFTVVTKDKRCYQANICCTTKEIVYYRINEYFKEYPLIEYIIKNKSKNEYIKKELLKISKLKNEIVSYIKKQKTIYREFNQSIENLFTEVYSIGIDDYKNKIYKNMLQDIRDTKKALIKSTKINKKIATLQYHLFKDLRYYLQENYNYQKAKIKKEIEILEDKIKNFDIYTDGLSQKMQDLKKLKDKLKNIPQDGVTRIEQFLRNLDLKIDSKNIHKYDTNYIFLYNN